MKQLKFKFDLDSKVAIYVPSTVAVNNDDSEGLQEKFTREVLSLFSRWFGGATATDALGGWVSGGGRTHSGESQDRLRLLHKGGVCRSSGRAA